MAFRIQRSQFTSKQIPSQNISGQGSILTQRNCIFYSDSHTHAELSLKSQRPVRCAEFSNAKRNNSIWALLYSATGNSAVSE